MSSSLYPLNVIEAIKLFVPNCDPNTYFNSLDVRLAIDDLPGTGKEVMIQRYQSRMSRQDIATRLSLDTELVTKIELDSLATIYQKING